MKRACFALILMPAAMLAQRGTMNFQQIQDAPVPAGVGRGARGVVMPLPRAETGRPFSATVTTQTTQTLADGTHLNQTSTRLEYRDSDGRTRTENQGMITIRDPIAQTTYRLDPAKKSAITMAAPTVLPQLVETSRGARGGRGNTSPEAAARGADVARALDELYASRAAALLPIRSNSNETTEDLGTSIVNGVSARGTRTTTIVPVGAIGNDRELRSVTERWFSSDLNLLIKSISTDPRFGTTTYELTNIKQANPEPSLFQVPSDYTTVSNGGR